MVPVRIDIVTPTGGRLQERRGEMEYKVIIQSTTGFLGTNFPKAADALSAKVNELANEGWEPLGGICCADSKERDLPYLMQAMVRRTTT